MALDGETNLKEKVAILENYDEKETPNLTGEVYCDTPNEFLDYWEANITSTAFKDVSFISLTYLRKSNALLRICY